MDQRRAAGALLALVVCIASTDAAPTISNQTGIDLYDGAVEGCYYNFQHYGEGDRIMTNEPCLNCTCHNRMLMCYLRVCPFTKPIGQDCTVEKRADQCCPIVTCPDVPVDLLTSTSTTSPAEYGATGLGKLDKYGCSINGKYFPEGSKVPPTPNKPCEHCYCIRNMTTCVMQECTLHVDGCTPIYHKDVCCPVRYSCDHPEDSTLLLDDMTTTVRPTPGFLLTTTTLSPVTQMSQDCVHDDQIFPDGALIKTEKACEHCYCMKGDIVCVVQECGTPMENEGKNCTSQLPREGQCCPDTYICEGDEVTMEPPSEFPTESQTTELLNELTTLSPPRRVGVEGSGYRNEPDEPTYTESPTIETEPEGSGYEQPTEPAGIDESNLLTSESPEISTESIEESLYPSKTTVRTPTLEEVEKTTEPDKGLNTVPSDASEEEMYKPSMTDKTPFEEPKTTEATITSEAKPTESEEKPISSDEESMPVATTKSEESLSTTESAFRKDDTFTGLSTETYNLGEPEKASTQATDIENETEEDVISSKTKAPFMEELEKQTTLSPESTKPDAEQDIAHKESTTESLPELTTSAEIKPVEKDTTETIQSALTTQASIEITQPSVEKIDTPEPTNQDQNEIEDMLTTVPPARIPGEGDCLLNDITYRNNSNVPSTNNCHTGCRCVSSIIKCDPIICSPPPEYMDNCQPTYDSPNSCCPTYVCHTGETMPPQPHSQMSGTDSPMSVSPNECHGDECEIKKDVPVVGDCGAAGCGDSQAGQPETPLGDCHDGKCTLLTEPCTNGKCQETPSEQCENGKCGIEPEIVPVKNTPLCENESECEGTIPEVPPCEGDGCTGVDVSCSGTDCSADGVQQPSIPGQYEESKMPEDELTQPCTETSCRRKETGAVDSSLPTDCSGSECTQQIPSQVDDLSTASPVADDTGIITTQQLEITTTRYETQPESQTTKYEDESKLEPTDIVPTIGDGSSSNPLAPSTEVPGQSSQVDHTVISQSFEEDLSTSEPETSVSDGPRISDTDASTKEPQDLITEIQEELSPVTESQDAATKVDIVESESTKPDIQQESTESPHDMEIYDRQTTLELEQELSTRAPETSSTELPEMHEEPSTKAPEQVPELEETDKPRITTEVSQPEPTTEGPVQHGEIETASAIPEKDENAQFTNAPTESYLEDKTSIMDSATEKILEPSTESAGEPEVLSTEQPVRETTEKTEVEPGSGYGSEDNDLPVPDTKAEISTPSSDAETLEEGTTQASVSEDKTTVSETLEKPAAEESPDTNEVTQGAVEEPSEKPETPGSVKDAEKQDFATDSDINVTEGAITKQPSMIPDDEFKTDEPESVQVTEQQEISTEEPAIDETPVKDMTPSEPYIPVHPETTPDLTTAQPDIVNEIPDSYTIAPKDEKEMDTKIPDRLDEPTESPELKVPATEVSATELPEVSSETPAIDDVNKNEYPESTEKSSTPGDITKEKLETNAPESFTTEIPTSHDEPEKTELEKESTTTERTKEQPSEGEQEQPFESGQEHPYEPGKYSTVPEIQETTIPESSVKPVEIEDTGSESPYATSAPESHVKEPQETDTTESHDETVTEGLQRASTEASGEKPVEEMPDISHDDQPGEMPELPQDSVTALPERPSTVLLEVTTEPTQEVKPQEEDKTTEKPTEQEPSIPKSPDDESFTKMPQDITTPPSDSDLHEKYTVTVSQETTSLPDGTVALKEQDTEKPIELGTQAPGTDSVTDAQAVPTEEPSTEDHTTFEVVELEEHSHKPVEDMSTVSPTDEENVSEPTKEFSPEIPTDTSMDYGEPHRSTILPSSEESHTDSTTTIQPGIQIEDQRFGEDTSKEEDQPTKTSPETESPITDFEIPVQTERVPTEKVTESDLSHETTFLEEVSPVTSKIVTEKEEGTPLEEKPAEPPLDESTAKPLKEPTEKPVEQPEQEPSDKTKPSKKPSDEDKPTESPLEKSTEIPKLKPQDEIEEKTTETPERKPVDDKVPTETPQEVPEEQPQEVSTEKSQEVLEEQPQEVPTEKPQEIPEEQPQEVSTEKSQEVPEEQSQEVPTEKPQEVPEKQPQEESTEKSQEVPEEKPQEVPEEQPQEVSTEKSQEVPEEQPQEVPTEKPHEVPEEQPQEVPTEKPQEVPEEQPQEVPTEKPQEVPTEQQQEVTEEQPQEVSTEKSQEVPEKQPQEVTEEQPQEIPEEQPQEVPTENPQEVPEEQPQEVPTEKPQEVPEEQPQEVPERQPQEVPTEKPQEVPEEQEQEVTEKQPQEVSTEKSQEVLEEQPQEEPTEKPQEIPEEQPQEVSTEKSQEVPEEQPQELPIEKPQEVPEGQPQEVSTEKSQEVPTEKPQDVPEEQPQEVPVEQPQEVPEEKPEEMPTKKPLVVPEEQPEEVTTEKSQEVPEEQPQEVPSQKPQEVPEEQPQEMATEKPQEVPEGQPQEVLTEKPFEVPEGLPQEVSTEKSQEVPEEQTTGKPQEVPEEQPQEVPTEKPQEVPEEQSQEVPTEKPLDVSEQPQELPKEKPEVSEENPQEVPEEQSQEVPTEKPQEVPEEQAQELPTEKPQEVPEEQPHGVQTEKPLEVSEQPQELPKDKPEVPEEKPQEVPEEQPQEVPTEKPQEVPEEQPQEVQSQKPLDVSKQPQELPKDKPEVPEVKPQQVPEEQLQEVPIEKPQELPEEKPQELPEEKPQEMPEEKPQEVHEEKPEEVPEEKPIETASTASPELTKPGFSDMQPTDEVPDEDSQFPPSAGTSGYGTEPDYVEEDQAFGPGTCRYGGKVYVSAQQIPRDDPCDFCFCFRSDIICLQQSCPPPIHGCHEEPIQGFCCPRYECPVAMATTLNVTTTTTTTTTTLPPHFLPHAYKGAAQRRGCQIKGHTYKVGEVVRASSGPCLHCTCGGDGQMKCDPKACTPEPMLRQMIAAAVSAKRRR